MAQKLYQKFEVLLATIFMVIFLLWIFGGFVKGTPLPEFATYQDVKEKKLSFISYFTPEFVRLNKIIEFRRQKMLLLLGKNSSGEKLTGMEYFFILELAKKYRIEEFDIKKQTDWLELSKRVDIIPVSIGVAQGAIESAWGTSRFAREGNNFFGIWCFTKGCGLVPKNRSKNLEHEVREYDDAVDSVVHFMHTLNTNDAYKDFRSLRHKQRLQSGKISGYELAGTLKKYSAIGDKYVKLIRDVIKGNDLE